MRDVLGLLTIICVCLIYQTGICDIKIQGRVADTKGEPVANALVELYTQADSLLYQDRTDNSGHYVLWFSTGVSTESLPDVFQLFQNYPNPFGPATTISWSSPSADHFTLVIRNILGQTVRCLTGYTAAGVNQVAWNGRDKDGDRVQDGVYFFILIM